MEEEHHPPLSSKVNGGATALPPTSASRPSSGQNSVRRGRPRHLHPHRPLPGFLPRPLHHPIANRRLRNPHLSTSQIAAAGMSTAAPLLLLAATVDLGGEGRKPPRQAGKFPETELGNIRTVFALKRYAGYGTAGMERD
ncbi:sulfate transmembrane transporter [Actinidia rufa]|uniref:Sulfate transmembrane transporter n=1 Tax=Actinidia rufa TaxID=165716 RepID=A0A7J0GHC7_9ERIC|nr:sulfate transmembrane transporter [Actinidia rufa]